MKTVFDLALSCPDRQFIRCKLAHAAVVEGDWSNAARWLQLAAAEEQGAWAEDAAELAKKFEVLSTASQPLDGN